MNRYRYFKIAGKSSSERNNITLVTFIDFIFVRCSYLKYRVMFYVSDGISSSCKIVLNSGKWCSSFLEGLVFVEY